MDTEKFEREAHTVVDQKLAELGLLSFSDAADLPEALYSDIVVTGKEVQMTIFRQLPATGLPDAVLVTVQLARASLGGLISYHYERALVYSASGEVREATQNELSVTGG